MKKFEILLSQKQTNKLYKTDLYQRRTAFSTTTLKGAHYFSIIIFSRFFLLTINRSFLLLSCIKRELKKKKTEEENFKR